MRRHPQRPIYVPVVQPAPLLTEDRRAEAAAQDQVLRELVPGPSAQGDFTDSACACHEDILALLCRTLLPKIRSA
eukprot:1157097-Pelagomonas_calceolata.AAC.14